MLRFISKSFDVILLMAIILSVLLVFIDLKLTSILVASLVAVLIVKKILVFLSLKFHKRVYLK